MMFIYRGFPRCSIIIRMAESDMKRKKSWYKRRYVNIMLLLVLLASFLGLIGYAMYYTELCYPEIGVKALKNQDIIKILKDERTPFFRPIFSTIKLFGMVFDVKDADFKDINSITPEMATAYRLIAIARILAVFPSGAAVFGIVKRLLPSVWMRISYILWSLNPFIKKRLLLIGNNSENARLFQTAKTHRGAMLFSESGKDTAVLRQAGVRCCVPESDYLDAPDDAGLELRLKEQLQRTLAEKNRRLTVIINTRDAETNLHLCRAAVACVQDAVKADQAALKRRQKELDNQDAEKDDPVMVKLRFRIVEKLERVHIFVFGDKQHEQVYYALENAAFGTLHYTNKYHLCSFDFLSRYPMTQFLTGQNAALLDESGCVAADMDFNMIFVGFGDTNREIFLDSFSTNHFLVRRNHRLPELKSVRYHIFDRREEADHDRNLNHSLFRYMDDFEHLLLSGKLKKEDYLELPPRPEEPVLYEMSIDSEAFYDKVWAICAENPKSVNYLVVAFGDDFSNIDLAQRLAEKKKEWGLTDLYIFVKIRDRQNQDVSSFLINGAKSPYIPFGNEDFTLDQVIHNEIEEIAYKRKRATLNAESASDPLKALTRDSVRVLYSWYTMDQITRRSNIYNILGVRMKLHLLGLDYEHITKENENKTLSEDAYFKIYATGCRLEDTKKPDSYRGARKSYNRKTYREDYTIYLPRPNLAVQEHYRWNAFMIRNGFIPATRAQIREGKFKSYTDTRYHANLCAFEALFEFRQMKNEWYAKHEPKKKPDDVIAYDYKLMDEAQYFLDVSGYGIVKRKEQQDKK